MPAALNQVVQVTVEGFAAKARELKASASRQSDILSLNNGRLKKLAAKVEKIADAGTRGRARSRVSSLVANQGRIAGMMRSFNSAWRAVMAKFKTWADQLKVPMPSGLGAAIAVVPAVIVGALGLAAAGVAAIALGNANASKAIDRQEQIIDAVVAGKIDGKEASDLMAQVRPDPPKGPDPLGLSTLSTSLTPIVIAAAVVAVVGMTAKGRR
jgi:hypothetical protein